MDKKRPADTSGSATAEVNDDLQLKRRQSKVGKVEESKEQLVETVASRAASATGAIAANCSAIPNHCSALTLPKGTPICVSERPISDLAATTGAAPAEFSVVWRTATVAHASDDGVCHQLSFSALASTEINRIAEGLDEHVVNLIADMQMVPLWRWPFLAYAPSGPRSKADPEKDDPRRVLMAVHFSHEEVLKSVDTRTTRKKKVGLGTGGDQRSWLKQLSSCHCAESIADLVEEHGVRFDAVNVSAALHRLARNTSKDTVRSDSDDRVRSAVSVCLKRARSDKFVGYSTQAAANICWALAKLGLRGRSTGVTVNEEAKADDGLDCDLAAVFALAVDKCMMELCWAACANWSEVSAYSDDWARSGLWGGWKPQELANLCWALSRSSGIAGCLAGAERRLLCVVAQGLLISSWYGFSPQEMTQVMAALLSTGLAPPFFMHRTLAKVTKHIDMFKPQELCVLLGYAARFADNKAVDMVLPALLQILDAAAASDLKGFLNLDLANLVGTLGLLNSKMNTRTSRQTAGTESEEPEVRNRALPFLRLVIASARQSLETWRLEDIETLVYSLSILNLVDDALLSRVSEHLHSLLTKEVDVRTDLGGKVSVEASQRISKIATSFSKCAHLNVHLMSQLCARASSTLCTLGRCVTPSSASAVPSVKSPTSAVITVAWAVACQLALCKKMTDKNKLGSALHQLISAICAAESAGQLTIEAGSQDAGRIWLACLALRASSPRSGESASCGPASVSSLTVEAKTMKRWKALRSYQCNDFLSASPFFCDDVRDTLRDKRIEQVFGDGFEVEQNVDLKGLQVDIVIRARHFAPVVVQLNDTIHFVWPVEGDVAWSHRPTGQTLLKNLIIHHIVGVEVVSVPFYEWRERGREAKVSFLQGLLSEAVARMR